MKRAGSIRRRVQAAIALIERDGAYLICRRLDEDVLGGYWEFPGGKRRVGESWPACLRRELREELGIAVRALRLCEEVRHRDPARSLLLKVYACRIARGNPKPIAAQALRWVSAARLDRYRFPPANRALLDRIVRGHYRNGRPV